MIVVENRHTATPIALESTPRGTQMQQQHSMVKSEKAHPVLGRVFGTPLALAIQFIRRALHLLLTAFIITIFHPWRKAFYSRPDKRRPANYAIKPRHGELKLNAATQLEDQFIALASHELKTPMTTISGHTQLLLRRLSRVNELTPEMVIIRTALESIDGQTRRLNAVVNELLELSSIRAGKIDLHTERCNLTDICRQLVEQEVFFSNRRIDLTAPSTPVLLQADCNRLNNLIINLLDNALKYSAPSSPVEVHVSQLDHSALIKVRDFGPGIPADQQARLFEPFYRGPQLQASPYSGLGLGLTICKEIVDRHGGKIWCESQEDSGSTFYVQLPLLA
jgi:signal transduction histidine kinase